MIEQSVSFGQPYTLQGTLAIPESDSESCHAILILPGSGPLDRDGNGKKQFNLYNQLADHLTNMGYATLRYDKRGVGQSEGEFIKTGMIDFVEDAKNAIHFLKSQSNIKSDQIIIAGHSEGCMLATAVAAELEVAGIIYIAGAGETLQDALNYQRQLISKELKEKQGFTGFLSRLLNLPDKVMKQGLKLERKITKTNEPVIRYQMIKMPAKWFQEHFNYNLFSDLRKIQCPILAVTGEKDIQTNPDSLSKLYDYLPMSQVTTQIIPNMNHMLRDQDVPKSSLAIKKVYKNIGSKELSPELITVLQDWLKRYV